jgi:hypothetical protein
MIAITANTDLVPIACQVLLETILEGRYRFYPHFIGEGVEAQRCGVVSTGSHSQEGMVPSFPSEAPKGQLGVSLKIIGCHCLTYKVPPARCLKRRKLP